MQLKHVSDSKLHADLKGYIRQEREVLTIILHHLREVEKRRLYSSYHHPSLFLYATKELGYSEDQAGRRISAMRMMNAQTVTITVSRHRPVTKLGAGGRVVDQESRTYTRPSIGTAFALW